MSTTDPLTPAEHEAMKTSARLFKIISKEVIGDGQTRGEDLREVVFHIHAIQRMILSQAAARMYPDLYRPLGGALWEGDDDERK